MSASSTPTLRPRRARPRARLVVTVDLPTPPLPLATATMERMPGIMVPPGPVEGFEWPWGRWAAGSAPPPWPPVPWGARSAVSTAVTRSEEHTSELQSLMRISYAVFCLKKKKKRKYNNETRDIEINTTTRSEDEDTE